MVRGRWLGGIDKVNRLSRSNWRLDLLGLAGVGVTAFDLHHFVGCRCWLGQWVRFQGTVALLLVALIVGRFLVAWIAGERNNGWKYYLAVLVASPLLVKGAFALASLALPPDLRFHAVGL